MAERFSCARRSILLGEPCFGTASQVRRWLLIEQTGGWGRDAVSQSRLPSDVASGLRALARSVGARLLLIRRPGRSAPTRRTCYAAVSTADVHRIEQFCFADPSELLDVDWTPLQTFEAVGGQPVDALYLVCTNGSHDVCCAEFGRPVARALYEAFGDAVWEVSHIGGDRFAGNLVCLPHGVYYGRVEPDDAVDLVHRYASGQLDLERYRGRSHVPFAGQAAEYFVRRARGLTGLHDVAGHVTERLDASTFRVRLVTAGAEAVTATVVCSEAIDPQQLTCRSTSEEHPPRYELVSLD